MLGHELRNPLSAVANASHLLDSPLTGGDAAARARSIIRRQVAHLSRLVDDLLDVTRAMMGKIVLRRRPIDLADATAHAVTICRSTEPGKSRRIVGRLESAWIDADPTRVEQIATNLLNNAVKYTPPGGAIEVSVQSAGPDAILRVVDDGIGMPPDLVARVFEPFVQGDRELDRPQGGLGLGLTLIQRLTALHGGTASARSDGPNRGSEFIVTFPSIRRPTELARPAAPEPSIVRDVLVVDDDADARDSLRLLLELRGHRVRIAADAASALIEIRAATPDVVFIDIGLPMVDGYELVRRIRAETEVGRRPMLIALTGYGLPQDRQKSAEAGFDVHLVKPAEPTEIDRLLAHRLSLVSAPDGA
ncbi:MAG: hybrid sensor histidine kinase/response regulator [Candidatus Binatia bacterium]